MEKIEFKVLELFTRYLIWIEDNKLEDNINNYILYVNSMDKNSSKDFKRYC
ncbi:MULTISPECIES: hypothetical protein [unclassified Clostridium]|uniref:hypothetical protein n=1 Tax=unclassified Clostridium TaxID=2614128 RepID=UPI0002D54931|nr:MULTISPECIES: hypothetical protein [unclassified Clostridium]